MKWRLKRRIVLKQDGTITEEAKPVSWLGEFALAVLVVASRTVVEAAP